jgi:DNA-3-methyladenine glycosylase I
MYCYKCGKGILAQHNFCSNCGTKLDFSFLQRHMGENHEEILENINFNDLFRKIEETIKQESTLLDDQVDEIWGKFKKYHYTNDDDREIYWKLVQVIFYSGMNAATVSSKLSAIKNYLYDYNIVKEYTDVDINRLMNEDGIIHNIRKIEACVRNAIKFNDIINEFTSFKDYLESFGDLNDRNILGNLKIDLINRFDFLGNITAYHLMLDLGLKVWKPDRVICRILKRLGLLDNPNDIDRAVEIGREIADQVGEPIRYIDIIFVKYGQQGNEEPFGLQNGICLEKSPRCEICGISRYCRYH